MCRELASLAGEVEAKKLLRSTRAQFLSGVSNWFLSLEEQWPA